MDAEDIVLALRISGHIVTTSGDSLDVQRKGGIDPTFIPLVREHKAQIIRYLDLTQRLERGAALLEQMEQRGETRTKKYDTYLYRFESLLVDYESRGATAVSI